MTAVLPAPLTGGLDEDLWAGGLPDDAPPADDEYPDEPTPAAAVPTPTPPKDFWARRLVLAHIRDFARARRVAPWAVLGATLARVITCCQPNVQLPPTIGSHASLNLFVGLVAGSGGGKDAAGKVARDAVDLGQHETFITVPLGSGEGLSHMFMKYGDNGLEQYNTAALVTIGEIDTMTALVKRQASTVGSQLRQAAMGEQLGFFYVDTAKRMLTPEHRYRLCLIAGIQPKRAGALLAEADGGTPQRFIWMPATDPDAPDEAPPCPNPMVWVPPVWHELSGEHVGGQYRNVIDVCDTAKDVIVKAHLARTRGTGDALDGHALLTRLKVAAALAILEGRGNIGDEDWELSGEVMGVSDRTRGAIERVLAAETRRENQNAAEAEAARTILVDDRRHEAATKRVTAAIVRRLADVGSWVPHAKLRGALASRDRAHFPAALNALILTGTVAEEPTGNRGEDGRRFRLVANGADHG